MAAVICLVTLSACASGNAERADEAATRESERSTNVVANIEATQVVQEFFETTVTPSPWPTAISTLVNLRLTTSLRDQDAPGDTVYSYTRGSGPLYADAQVADLHPGQRVIAVWSFDGQSVQTTEVGIDNERELVWIALRWDIVLGEQYANRYARYRILLDCVPELTVSWANPLRPEKSNLYNIKNFFINEFYNLIALFCNKFFCLTRLISY